MTSFYLQHVNKLESHESNIKAYKKVITELEQNIIELKLEVEKWKDAAKAHNFGLATCIDCGVTLTPDLRCTECFAKYKQGTCYAVRVYDYYVDPIPEWSEIYCSNCEMSGEDEDINYCPYCGAKVIGDA